ncbi:MAG TPA: carbohydrate-binding family 9-like protein [Phycisphaerae bacterium]|nr:carbohydrate-binding family 9-like protein [Phycisphaerae bacterium]
MKQYRIRRASASPPLNGDASAGPWPQADALKIDEYPWYTAGAKQATAVRALYDDEALYLQFLCEDRHIFAEVTELNGPVCKDSCVEFFATIEPDRRPDYFNVEFNCCGTRLGKWGSQRHGRKDITPAQAERIEVATSVPGPTKADSPNDDGWWLAVKLPLDLLSEFTGVRVRPASGTRWRGNFYRCGGRSDPQLACWNIIEWARPDYHRPEFFGEIVFE